MRRFLRTAGDDHRSRPQSAIRLGMDARECYDLGSSRSRGAHRLIRQGAKLVETVDDILEEIAPQLARQSGAAVKHEVRLLPPNSSAAVQKVFAMLQERSLQVDEIIEHSGLVPAEVLGILLDLELQGYLRQLPGKVYTVER